MPRLLACLGFTALLSGCAGVAASSVAGGSLPGLFGASALEIHNQTQVNLERANFVVVRTNVVGTSKGFALLGLITIVPPRFNTAMNRLYSQAEMQTGKAQTLVDIVFEKSSTFWILFSIPRVSVRADVVEFVPASRATSAADPPR